MKGISKQLQMPNQPIQISKWFTIEKSRRATHNDYAHLCGYKCAFELMPMAAIYSGALNLIAVARCLKKDVDDERFRGHFMGGL